MVVVGGVNELTTQSYFKVKDERNSREDRVLEKLRRIVVWTLFFPTPTIMVRGLREHGFSRG